MTAAPVRWGILGTGDINDRFLPGARLTDAVDIVAVGSRTAKRAAAFFDWVPIINRELQIQSIGPFGGAQDRLPHERRLSADFATPRLLQSGPMTDTEDD